MVVDPHRLLPFVLLFGFWIFLMNQVQGGGSKVMSFGKSRAKRMTPDSPKIGFKDVAGVDEAVEELQEIKEFLENPKKFQALGARIPKGVLLYGPPGTGKTLLARAVAGEAGVPFFSISGSDFVEMFVGVGASRVRDLFEQAKQASPCIVFMDEIDAVGRHRGAGLGGGHDEREQTLNQLLVEMDGFEMKDNIILIAATNRPDILDPALLRPGRFDRQIVVDRPDRNGRRKILEVHSKGKPLAPEIDLDTLAAGTPGFTGADLANLVNEAALLAARRGKKMIEQEELEEGIMRVLAGPREEGAPPLREGAEDHRVPRDGPRARRPLPREHEPGPQDHDRLARPGARPHDLAADRGPLPADAQRADGRPRDDARRPRRGGARLPRDHDGRRERPREGHAHGEADDHALRDEREARPARARPQPDMPFLGREMGHEPDYSDEVAREIDEEIRRVIEEAHDRATRVLREHMDELHRISAILIERETIDKDQFERLAAGEAEETVFPDEEPEPEPAQPEEERKRLPQPKPRPFPRPGARCSRRRRPSRTAPSRRRSRSCNSVAYGRARGGRHLRRAISIEERFPRPSVMGVVNVTPDSFSDGGVQPRSRDAAAATARRMLDEGAAIVDVGGESTRPGLGRRLARRGAAARRAGARAARGRGARLDRHREGRGRAPRARRSAPSSSTT